MRIGCLQFAPQVGDTENNLNRADAVLSRADPDNLDLLVLPELAFSGYNFKSLKDIVPYLEHSGSGITSLWARTVALKYNCIVTAGYPEKVDVTAQWPTGPEYYNSAIVVNDDGETIANYRKSFLYYTDETWALEGDGFFEGYIPGLGNTSIGICMDLNPYKFEAPWNSFEFAFHVLEMESNLVIVSMAWLTREDKRSFTSKPNEPDMETLTYWVTRLEPLIRDNSREEIIVVFCNRTGIEDDVTYAGTSAVIGILDGEVHVYGILGRGQKELLVVDTNQPPYAKLVHRPQGSATDNGTDQAAPSGENDDKGPQPDGSGDKEERDDNESKGPVPGETGDPSPDGSSVSGRSHSSRGSFKSASNNSVGPSKRAGRKKPVDPIMVPPRGYQNHGDGDLKTPGSAAIPTPSAPSPTPMALRPRLIIPESPPFQHPIDRLDSAASFLSDRTEASLQSDFSEASIQTIRSNGRPPEDSTPYPHSGAPLSGYPSNSFHGSSHSLSSSTGSARDFGDFRSDARPYDSTSPYAGSPWRSPDYLNTPKSFGAGTPIGRRPEPFPWEAITGTPQADPTPAVAATPGNTFVPVPESNSGRRPSRSVSSNRTTQASNSRSGSVAGRQSRASVRSTKRATGEESMSRRRNPPKSRSASCFRNDERSHSSFGERNATGSLGLYVDDLPQRAESANSMRTPIAPSATPVFERPPSPKSRNCSRSRPELDEGLPIPISACPSILPPMTSTTPEAREFYRSASNSRRRVGGRRTSDAVNPGLYTRTASPFTGPNASTSSSRTVARGRSPRPQMMTAPPLATERSSSIDSVRNDRLHTRVSRRGSRSQANDGTPHRHYRSVSRPQEDLSQFERVEAIVCAHCPLHGNGTPGPDAPASGGHHASNHGPASSGPSRRSESRQNPSRSTSRDSQASADGRAETFADRSHSRARVETSSSHGSPSQATDVSDSDWSLQGASSQSVSSASQSVFDPPTPRAMSFDKKRDEMSLTLAGLSESTVEIALAPYDDVSPVSTVKTPVASLRA